MQPVDVLRDDPAEHALLLKRGHRPVPGVGPRGDDPPPADVSAGPVALTSLRRAAELSDRHREPGAQRAARTAIVRNTRLSRQAAPERHTHRRDQQAHEADPPRRHPSAQLCPRAHRQSTASAPENRDSGTVAEQARGTSPAVAARLRMRSLATASVSGRAGHQADRALSLATAGPEDARRRRAAGCP